MTTSRILTSYQNPKKRVILPNSVIRHGHGSADGRTTSPLRTTGRLKSPISHSLRPEQSFKSGPKCALVHRRPPARSRTAANIGNRGRKFAEKTICPGPDGIFIRRDQSSKVRPVFETRESPIGPCDATFIEWITSQACTSQKTNGAVTKGYGTTGHDQLPRIRCLIPSARASFRLRFCESLFEGSRIQLLRLDTWHSRKEAERANQEDMLTSFM
jgi:hypothetical protein